MSSSDLDEFLTKDIYNMAIKTGTGATNKVDKTTVNNIIELFQGDPYDSIITIMLYIKRQEKRGEINYQTAKALIEDLNNILNKFKKGEAFEKATRKYLLIFKWAYESEVHNAKDINDFIQKIISR